MNVLVLGGYGLIGFSTVKRLLSAGYSVTGLGRSVAAARISCPEADWVEADISHLTTPCAWCPFLAEVDMVVNCAGALQDSPRDNLQALQTDAMAALFSACEAASVRHVVQISAVGVSQNASTAFYRTKAVADAALVASSLSWIILKPGLVIAPAAYGGTALIRASASWPFVLPVPRGTRAIQTVDVDDVASAVLASLDGRLPARRCYDIVERTPQDLASIVQSFSTWLGYGIKPVWIVPSWISRVVFRAGDALAYLGWRPPIRTTALRQLQDGVTGNPSAWIEALGQEPSSLKETLRRFPANVQERWFGRLWLLKPIIVGTLSLFWLASGAVGLLKLGEAALVLTSRGFDPSLSIATVVGGSVLDLALGLAILIRRLHRQAALGMMALTVFYLVGGSFLAPDLWLDPLGSLVKPIPAAILALVALAIAEER